MTESFSDRQNSYESIYDYEIISRIPIIIRVNGRNFKKLTNKLQKPFCPELLSILGQTMLHSIMEIEGAVIGYQAADKLTFVLRNDRNSEDQPFYNNKIQKLVSVVSSIVSVNFAKSVALQDFLDLDGDAIFDAKVFALPSLNEAINHLILRQQICIHDSIFHAAYAELSKLYGKNEASTILYGKKALEKIQILKDRCNINYDEYFPSAYRLGIAAYKIPKILRTKDGDIHKNKWILDLDIPQFVQDKNFISNIIRSGHDVFRADRDLILA